MGKEYSRQRALNEQQYQFEREEAEKARSFNSSEASITRDFNASEAEKTRQFEYNTMLQQQQYQTDQWQREANFELQHRFDVPSGANPAVYFASKGGASGFGGSVSSPSGISAPAASGGSPASSPMPSHSTPGALPDSVPAFIANLGQFVNALGSAAKQGIDTAQAAKQFNVIYDRAVAEVSGMKLQNAFQDFINYASQVKLPVELEKSLAEVGYLQQQKLLAISQGKTFDSESALNYAKENTEKAMSKLRGTEGLVMKWRYDHLQQEFDADMALKLSQKRESDSSASLNYARANESASVTKLNELHYLIEHNMQGALEDEIWNRAYNLQKEGSLLDWQIDAAKSVAEIQSVNASHAELLFWKDFISGILQDGFDAFLGYKNAKSFERLSKSSQDNVAHKIEQMKWQYGDKVRLEDTKNGVKRTREYSRPYSKYGSSVD